MGSQPSISGPDDWIGLYGPINRKSENTRRNTTSHHQGGNGKLLPATAEFSLI